MSSSTKISLLIISSFSFLLTLFLVTLVEEVNEEEEERNQNSLSQEEDRNRTRARFVVSQIAVYPITIDANRRHKLKDLQGSDVLLPPNILVAHWTHPIVIIPTQSLAKTTFIKHQLTLEYGQNNSLFVKGIGCSFLLSAKTKPTNKLCSDATHASKAAVSSSKPKSLYPKIHKFWTTETRKSKNITGHFALCDQDHKTAKPNIFQKTILKNVELQ